MMLHQIELRKYKKRKNDYINSKKECLIGILFLELGFVILWWIYAELVNWGGMTTTR